MFAVRKKKRKSNQELSKQHVLDQVVLLVVDISFTLQTANCVVILLFVQQCDDQNSNLRIINSTENFNKDK